MRKRRAIARPALVAFAAIAVIGVLVWRHSEPPGDPGGQVMDQLAPSVSALPGFDTPTIHWVDEIPQSLDASYAIKMEPHQDSCDGRAGTRGWSQVAVQAGFRWNHGLEALVRYMDPTMVRMGWTAGPALKTSITPTTTMVSTGTWTKPLRNRTRAFASVTQEEGAGSAVWQFVALGAPIGKAASGC